MGKALFLLVVCVLGLGLFFSQLAQRDYDARKARYQSAMIAYVADHVRDFQGDGWEELDYQFGYATIQNRDPSNPNYGRKFFLPVRSSNRQRVAAMRGRRFGFKPRVLRPEDLEDRSKVSDGPIVEIWDVLDLEPEP
jgi:hypothetical protein